MAKTGESNYALSGALDTAQTLAQGGTVITTELLSDLAIDETDLAEVLDATGAPLKSVFVVDDETIYYEGRIGLSGLTDLARARAGSSAAAHTAGATVKIYGPPRFDNPALLDAVLEMQAKLNEYETRLTTLESA